MVSELYERCVLLTGMEPSEEALRFLHETLVLACAQALKGTRQGFGNVFSQVDYLCKRHGIKMHDRIAIQTMRRHSNGTQELTEDDWRYDLRALVLFISAVFQEDVPRELVVKLPTEGRPYDEHRPVNMRYVRCVVHDWDEQHIHVTTDEGVMTIIGYDESLAACLAKGMQLNLLDCVKQGDSIEPALIVVEPDYLVDISSIAACFQDYGHHPLRYLIDRLKPRANSQPMLLGNFAGTAMDDIIHQPDADFADSLRTSFAEQALRFCACEHFQPEVFKREAMQQVLHIREAVDVLFDKDYDRGRALLEPSFVCEHLGLQGRVDLMTDDLRLLVEQKSGKNWNIERPQAGQKGKQKEDHYVQLLLYYGVLRYNFQRSADNTDIRLLYSKYPAQQGLLVVNYYQELFREAIRLRNRIVAQEIRIACEGFHTIEPQLHADTLLENQQKQKFFDQYIRGEIDRVIQPFWQLDEVERKEVEHLLTFVYREQLAQKTGVMEGQGNSAQADLWNMPLSVKRETGAIIMGTLAKATATEVVLDFSSDVAPTLNFRRGDMVFLYRYTDVPDVRKHILYKGVVQSITETEVTVRLNEAQHNRQVFREGSYAIEHATTDTSSAALRSIMAFCSADPEKRNLLTGRREPRKDTTIALSRSYGAYFDDILLRAVQSRDYFLLQGPPGTGKTSQALRFLVEESKGNLLLTAYTNRAVDEICDMLEQSGQDYLRQGNEASCDPRFAHRLLSRVMGEQPRMSDMQQRLQETRIMVATTSTLLSQPDVLALKHFSLCIVDEASQILAPNIIGLLVSDSIDRFILVGDHKQLPAVVQQPDDVPELHACRQSLFEHLLRKEREAGRTDFVGLLRRQGRMHPDIAAFPNAMFYRREQLQPVPCPHQLEEQLDYGVPSEDHLDEILKSRRVVFLPSRDDQSVEITLLHRIYRQYGEAHFDPYHTVGVIVTYRHQIASIRHEIAQLGIPLLEQISIDTVERYQGSQRDVIICSFGVENPFQLNFLTSNCIEEDGCVIDRKLNVAMTRARKQLLLVGNQEVLRKNAIYAALIRRYAVNI